MKKNITTLILSLFLIFLTLKANIQSDSPIMVTLKMPAPGTLNMKDFWNITVTNNSGSEQSGYLVGTATEGKDGLIAKGTTVPILLKKGINNIKIKDLPKTPDVEYSAKDPRYKESLIRAGEFPSGKYEICVKVISAGTNEELGSDCINQEVGETGLLSLINPTDGEVIDTKVPVTFTWSSGGKIPEDGFTLRIVEINKDQSPESAMKSNRSYFEKIGIKSTSFQYPNTGKTFEDVKKYAWMVTSIDRGKEIATSEVGSFYRQACGALLISNIVTCIGSGSSMYNYLLTFQNLSNAITDPNCIVTVTSITISGITFTLSGLPTINPGQTVSVSGTIGPTSLSSGNFTINATSPGFTGTWNDSFILESVPPVPGAISGPNSVCQGQSGNVFSIPPVSGAVSYNWTVTGGTITVGQGSTSITVTFNGTSGNVCVTAGNLCGTSTPNCKAVNISAPSVPPVPIAKPATLIQQTQFTSNWTLPNNTIGFFLDVATDANFSNFVPGYSNKGVGTATLPLVVTGLTCNTKYYYRVRSVGACVGTSANSNVIVVSTLHTLNPAPAVFAATGIQATQFTANWAAVPGALNYFLDVYSLGTGVTYVPGYHNKNVGNVTTHTITGLNCNTNYKYRIRAVVPCGISASSQGISVNTTQSVPHGSWIKGPGNYTFTVAPYGTTADINGCPGQSIPITMEVWGAGGGGGTGSSNDNTLVTGSKFQQTFAFLISHGFITVFPGSGNNGHGGNGGGGGGGGGYAKTTINVQVLTNGMVTYKIIVGYGGVSVGYFANTIGAYGGYTSVRLNNIFTGPVILNAQGGRGGVMGDNANHFIYNGNTYFFSQGGIGGNGSINGWSGLQGGAGEVVTNCSGGAGGLGGPGGGPGRTGPGYFNDGGNGGHGGYYHSLIYPTCTDASQDYQLSSGTAGGNGRVVFTW